MGMVWAVLLGGGLFILSVAVLVALVEAAMEMWYR